MAAKSKLTYWDSNPNPGRTEGFTLAGQNFCRSRELEFEYVPVGIQGYADKVLSAWREGEGPAVVDMWPMWINTLKELLLPLDPWVSSWDAGHRYEPWHRKLSQVVDGKFWFLACDLFIQGTHYRKDLVSEAGLEDPRKLDLRGEWTWDVFESYVRRLHGIRQGVSGISLRGGQGAGLTALNLMLSATGGRYRPWDGSSSEDKDSATAVLKQYTHLAHSPRCSQTDPHQCGYREFAWNFYEGGAAFMLHNDDAVKAAQNRYLGREGYGTCRLPAPVGQAWNGLAGFGVAACKDHPHSDIAAEYILSFVENYGRTLNQGTKATGEEVLFEDYCYPMLPYTEKRNPLVTPFREMLEDSNRIVVLPWGKSGFVEYMENLDKQVATMMQA